MITVYIKAAIICFSGQCHPALVGPSTPVGQFELIPRVVATPGYGGDVLQFAEDDASWLAIHRVWEGNPRQRRAQRLASGTAADRMLTDGCINVTPAVYLQLRDCCSHSPIEVRP